MKGDSGKASESFFFPHEKKKSEYRKLGSYPQMKVGRIGSSDENEPTSCLRLMQVRTNMYITTFLSSVKASRDAFWYQKLSVREEHPPFNEAFKLLTWWHILNVSVPKNGNSSLANAFHVSRLVLRVWLYLSSCQHPCLDLTEFGAHFYQMNRDITFTKNRGELIEDL